jgi:dihydroorotate dehydrogenase (NAD+) catalytic subunit
LLKPVEICGIKFKNPLIAASGVYGFGEYYDDFYDLNILGGISCKGLTIAPKNGNPVPRIAETVSGMLNSVGLENPGVPAFCADYLPRLREKIALKPDQTRIIANLSGATIDDYVKGAELLDKTDIDFIELNISCPNVKAGGAAWGITASGAETVTTAVKKATTKPIMVKLTPNVTDITEIAKAAEFAGADALSLINTLLGMRIDIKTRRPILANTFGGLSGAAVFPVALRMVYQTVRAVSIPVVGLGGITSGAAAYEMLLAGAAAIQVGTAIISDPTAPVRILAELNECVDRYGGV